MSNKDMTRLKNYFISLYSAIWAEVDIANYTDVDINDYSLEVPKFINRLSAQKYYVKIRNKQLGYASEDFKNILPCINQFRTRDRSEFYKCTRDIANVLYWAEETLFYPNDDSKSVWSIIDKDNNQTSITFSHEDILIEVGFQESAINIPGKSKDNPLNFMNDSDSYATFVTVNITRNFGNNIVSSFKSLLDSNEFGLDTDDTYMLDLAENIMCNIMTSTLHDIEDHILKECCGIKNGLSVEDFINGRTIWRQKRK